MGRLRGARESWRLAGRDPTVVALVLLRRICGYDLASPVLLGLCGLHA